MLRAMITPLTLYNINNSIFDGISLPSQPFTDRGYTDLFLPGWELDKETFINNLLLETAELNVLYTDPDFFKFAVTQWANKEKHVWQSLYETMFFKYNPIWNKDGTITDTNNETRNLQNTLTVDSNNNGTVTEKDDNTRTIETKEDIFDTDENTRIPNLTESRDLTETNVNEKNLTNTSKNTKNNTGTQDNENNSTNENQVSAFDSSSYQNRDKQIVNGHETRTDNLTETENGSNVTTGTDKYDITEGGTVTNTGTEKNEREYGRDRTENVTDGFDGTKTTTTDNTGKETRNGSDTGNITSNAQRIEQGNIGVTTTQQMIESERELVKFNIYDYIISSFKKRFCILIY